MAENWNCHAARDLPLDTETAWDGAAAQAAMLDAAHIGGDNPDFEQARRGFLLVDDTAKELRGSYSLPFATVKNGRLTALISGCRAAASRLPQKAGVSDGERAKARAVLDAYFAKQDEKVNEAEPDRVLPAVFATPAPIARLLTSEDLTPAALKMAGDPGFFAERPPFFFRAEISNNQPDAYFTRMHQSTLKNFANDAEAGVSFQNSHRHDELGFGRSVRGEYTGPGGNGVARTEADFYTVPGLNLNGVNTRDLIDGMRAGLVKDVSVGFYGGSFRCGVCGRDLWDRECRHVPGVAYDRDDEPSATGEGAVNVAWVHDAHLAEVSAVYDGACPGAAIMKARQEAEGGRLRPIVRQLIEARYRVRLAGHARLWAPESDHCRDEPPPRQPSRREDDMTEEQSRALQERARGAEERIATLRRALALDDPNADPIAAATALIEQHRAGAAQRARLEAEAELGRQYHAALLEAALAEGVRAMGPRFPLEANRALWAGATVQQLTEIRNGYAAQGDQTLAGGRVSQDTGEPAPAGAALDWTPVAAFAG